MTLRQLVDQAETVFAGLPPLPSPFSVDAYIDVLQTHRQRPIMMRPIERSALDVPCGLWIDMGGFDLICYADEASPLLKDTIKLHELSHMLYGHEGVMDEDALCRALPDLPRKLIRNRLAARRSAGRTEYTTQQEREAEILATVIAEHADTRTTYTDPVLASLADSLGHPIRGRKR